MTKPLIKGLMESVRDWHQAASMPVLAKPEWPSPERERLRDDLLREELKELGHAMDDRDMVAVADGIADVIYVLAGTAWEYGIPLEAVMQEVCRSNNAKIVNGKVLKREDGKVLKPEGWTHPDIAKVLYG